MTTPIRNPVTVQQETSFDFSKGIITITAIVLDVSDVPMGKEDAAIGINDSTLTSAQRTKLTEVAKIIFKLAGRIS